jgi:UDP-glucose 4-epimerase|tara:strand:+ start:15918 stop:16781 length:864 start_codon:yes stop_codon:yes gene_type:complete
MSKILVTGGLGFVGSHLVDLLATKGHQITVIDNLCSESSNRDYMRDDVTYWIDDIRNINSYKYEDNEFDVVYHLAALARIQPSFKDPLTYLSIDIMGTSNVLDYARRKNAKVVYAGSSSAYAGPMLNPYAFAKYTGEQVCEMYNKVYKLSVVTARFFNVYGHRQPTSGAYATVVGVFEGQTTNSSPLTITGNGEQRRDFTHISDIVAGFEALGEGQHNAEIYQLGTGENYSINDLAGMFGGEAKYIPARPGEAWITLADPSAMKESTGWTPKVNIGDYVTNWLNKMA